MNAFDDLTMAELDDVEAVALAGTPLEDAPARRVAAGVMWAHARRDRPDLTWDDFYGTLTAGELAAFSGENMGESDPTNGAA